MLLLVSARNVVALRLLIRPSGLRRSRNYAARSLSSLDPDRRTEWARFSEDGCRVSLGEKKVLCK